MSFRIIGLLSVILLINSKSFGIRSSILDDFLCYEDKSSSLTIEQIAKASFQENFVTASKKIRQQSFSPSAFWFKIDLSDSTFSEPLHIISRNIFIDSLQLFYRQNGAWKNKNSGLLVTGTRNHLTPSIKLPSDKESNSYYLKVSSDCLSQLDLWLLSSTKLLIQESNKTLFHISLTALIFIYFFVSLFLFFLSKKKVFVFLGQYALSFIIGSLYMNGYIFKWFAIDHIDFYKWSFVWVLNFLHVSSLLFTFYVFDVRETSNRLPALYGLSFVYIAFTFLTQFFLDRYLVTKIHFFGSALFFLFNTCVAFYYFFKKKDINGLYLGLGWVSYFIFSFIWSLTKMGYLGNTFFTENATSFGIIIELLIFGFIAAKHYTKGTIEKVELENRISTIEDKKTSIEKEYGDKIRTLSNREKEVLKLISKGLLDKEIADCLSISLSSVRTYCYRIYTKLEVSNRTEASEIYHKMEALDLI